MSALHHKIHAVIPQLSTHFVRSKIDPDVWWEGRQFCDSETDFFGSTWSKIIRFGQSHMRTTYSDPNKELFDKF